MSIQGYLADAAGVALDGSTLLTVVLYDAASEGSVLHSADVSVTVDQGFFTALLDGIDLATIARDQDALWIGLAVEGDAEMQPRLQVTTTPWAASALHAVSADDADLFGGLGSADYRQVLDPIDWADLIGRPMILGETSCADGQFLQYDEAASAWACVEPAVLSELDPFFSASAAGSINSTDVAQWNSAFGWGDHSGQGYLTSEEDPLFELSAAAGINSTDLTLWNSAFGWGDHGAAGYLLSELDPLFAASDVAGVTALDINDWSSAYGWGDHSAAGYLTSYSETDPLFTVSPAAGISGADISNWSSAHGWGDHSAAGYLTSYSETDPLFSASEAATLSATDTARWDLASDVTNAGLEILDRDDPRLSFVGSWIDASGSWGENRLVDAVRYTNCTGVGTDCSANYIVLTLPGNTHRALSLSHLDWTNTGLIEVYVAVDGAPEALLRTILTTAPDRTRVGDYFSTMHPLATDLPLGSDVVVRVVATDGRLHFEGMTLSSNPLPVTIAPRTPIALSNSNTWQLASGLRYDFELDRAAVVDFDYGISGSISPARHILCRLAIFRPAWSWYPREGRSIVGDTTYFNVDGAVSGILAPGSYRAEVQCRTPGVISNDPGGNDYHDRFLRLRFPSP